MLLTMKAPYVLGSPVQCSQRLGRALAVRVGDLRRGEPNGARRESKPIEVPGQIQHSVIPFALGRELSGRIQGRKEFVVIAGGDLNDAVPADPQAYWTAIDRFVSTLKLP